MGKPLRLLASLYSALLLGVTAWALLTDVALLHSPREHLLPDMAVALVTFPASLSLGWAYETWPPLFSRPFAPLAWLVGCGLLQASFLFLMSTFARAAQTKR